MIISAKKRSIFLALSLSFSLFFLSPILIIKFIKIQALEVPVKVFTPSSEQYEPELQFLNSAITLEEFFLNTIQNDALSKIESVRLADDLLRKRFFHG